MGSKSGSGRRAEPNTCTDRKRGQDVGRHGHAKSAEGQAGELQDTAGAEGGRRITEKRHGQEYVLSAHPSLLAQADRYKSQQEKPGQGDIW